MTYKKQLAKLYAYGISGQVLVWLEHYFDKLTHYTRVVRRQGLSAEADLISGAVQGGSIGPVCFLIYVDKLAKLLEHHDVVVKLFADDVKVYLEIRNVDDSTRLQNSLDLISQWADEWQLSVSIANRNILSIGRSHDNT